VILTGATSGVGRQTALQLAALGFPLVLPVRDPARGAATRAAVLAAHPGATVDLLPLDLASLASVREFAATYATNFGSWATLVNNAGVLPQKERRVTVDGFELHFGTNHLGHFALTGLLLPFAEERARVITVTSLAARFGQLRFHDLRFDHGYRPMRAYAASKLANLLFARELDRKAAREGLDLVSVATHPGYSIERDALRSLRRLPERLVIAQDYAAGAGPNVRAVTDEALTGGELLGPDGRAQTRGAAAIVSTARIRDEEALATRLWRFSGQLTRVPW